MFDPPDTLVPFPEELIPVVTAPAAPAVLDDDVMLLLEDVGPEEAAQEAAVGSVTFALYCIYLSARSYGRFSKHTRLLLKGSGRLTCHKAAGRLVGSLEGYVSDWEAGRLLR